MNKIIRIGQIGIGHNHGEEKMKAFRKFPELFDVVGYAEDDPDWLEKRSGLDGYKGLTRMRTQELIDKCDAILVETGVPDLTKTAAICVEQGKHIHMDKPASGTLEEFKYVLDTAKAKNLVVQMGYMYRYNDAILKTFEMIREGRLGEIYSINAEMSTYHGVEYKKWLTGFEGGIQYILGSHFVDLIVYLLGEPKRIVSFLKHTKLDGVDFPDNNLAVLEYDKALARIFVSSVEVNGWGRRQFVVTGSKGSVSILPMERTTRMTYASLDFCDHAYQDMQKEIPVADLSATGRYDTMAADFYHYVMGSKVNPYTYEHDYLVQKVLLEIVKENKTQ
ncbi:MAG: Gfo/Idh/MocA family oxidoreductase [Clostridia bacterium]|nr:Gfo/Idh/MocA family oxidoreductase [Clostridia bacterium]